MNLTNITKEYDFSETEMEFLKASATGQTADINQSQIVSNFILSKRLSKMTDKLIAAEEKLAESNTQQSKRLNYLTGALVFVGCVQILVQIVGLLNK